MKHLLVYYLAFLSLQVFAVEYVMVENYQGGGIVREVSPERGLDLSEIDSDIAQHMKNKDDLQSYKNSLVDTQESLEQSQYAYKNLKIEIVSIESDMREIMSNILRLEQEIENKQGVVSSYDAELERNRATKAIDKAEDESGTVAMKQDVIDLSSQEESTQYDAEFALKEQKKLATKKEELKLMMAELEHNKATIEIDEAEDESVTVAMMQSAIEAITTAERAWQDVIDLAKQKESTQRDAGDALKEQKKLAAKKDKLKLMMAEQSIATAKIDKQKTTCDNLSRAHPFTITCDDSFPDTVTVGMTYTANCTVEAPAGFTVNFKHYALLPCTVNQVYGADLCDKNTIMPAGCSCMFRLKFDVPDYPDVNVNPKITLCTAGNHWCKQHGFPMKIIAGSVDKTMNDGV